ncbi:MAG: signal recognition particle-docking protein FtsY, partial [Candidatus Aenigmatarchaeota archaeon]
IEVEKEIQEIKKIELEVVEEVKEEIVEKVPEPEEIEKTLAPEVEEIAPEKQIEVKPVEVKEEPKKKGFFEKVFGKVVKKVVEKKLSENDVMPILSDLENGLIEGDVAYEVAEKVKNDLKKILVDREIKRGTENRIVTESIKNSLMEILNVPQVDLISLGKGKKPYLIVFFGFNGSGKTTSMAKVGKWLIENGHSCVFAAADTFRAAAEEQLEEHATRIGVKVIKHQYGADPAAVIYDAVEHAKANGIDFVLADTAGRAHTNKNLMDQMQKIVRVNKPDLKLLVIDSLTGNDAVIQARMYNEIGIDGLIFTKVDVNEKGGAILSVTHELKKPILFIGLGQEYKDFQRFDAEKFVSLIMQ